MVIGENISENMFDLLWTTAEESPILHWPNEVAARARRIHSSGLVLRYCYNMLWGHFVLAQDIAGLRYVLFQEARASNPMNRLANSARGWHPSHSWLACALCGCAFNAPWGTMLCRECSGDITIEAQSYASAVTMEVQKEERITCQCAPRTGTFLLPTPGRCQRYVKNILMALGACFIVAVLYKLLVSYWIGP